MYIYCIISIKQIGLIMIRELHNFLLRAGFERAASCLSSIDEKINNLSKVIKSTFVGTSLFQIIWKDDLDRDARALINKKTSQLVVSPAQIEGLALVGEAEKEGRALVGQAEKKGQALVQAARKKLVGQAEKEGRALVRQAKRQGEALVRRAEKKGSPFVVQAKEEKVALLAQAKKEKAALLAQVENSKKLLLVQAEIKKLVVQAAINKESLVTQAKKEADALFVQACGVITDTVVQQVAQEVWQTCYSGCLLGDFRKESIQKSIKGYIRADHQLSLPPETRVSSLSSVSDATTDEAEDNIPPDDLADANGNVFDCESSTPPEDTDSDVESVYAP